MLIHAGPATRSLALVHLQVEVEDLHSLLKYNTNDIFMCVDDTWICHVCRADDLIVHASGEKTNPVPLEVSIMEQTGIYVEKLCIVGNGLPRPVVILQLSQSGTTHSFVAAKIISKAIISANASAPSYSRLNIMEALVLLPDYHKPIPLSSKGNVVRSATEALFARDLQRLFKVCLCLATALNIHTCYVTLCL